MAYIPNTYLPITKRRKTTYNILPIFNGVKLSPSPMFSEDALVSDISNFDFRGCSIGVRENETCLSEALDFEGDFHSVASEPFCDRVVFHAGNVLYSYKKGDAKAEELSDILPDKKSIMCHFLSKLYIYCDFRVFSLDNNFVFTEEVPDAPLAFENISPIASIDDKTVDNLNMIAPIIKVIFAPTSLNNFNFPVFCDTEKPVRIWVDDVEADKENITIEENRCVVKGFGEGSKKYTVIYYVKNPEEIGFNRELYDCTLTCAFGGNANGGTRILFTGNSDFKGRYYKSELMNPLYIGKNEYETIGNGCENITALKKMYGNLIIFTENSVFRMGYILKDDGAVFSVKELSCDIGCDCPGSVQLIDNRVVFANSQKGVFIVDSTGEADEQNIKPIAGNILKGSGRGLLDISGETMKKAASIDFDRKYLLMAGDRVYIWNYDRTPFADYGNYSKSQEKLEWSIYDDIVGNEFFNIGGMLCVFDYNRKQFFTFSDDLTSLHESRLKTSRMYFSDLSAAKYITDFELTVTAKKDAEISLVLYGDGAKYYENVISLQDEKRSLIKLKLPKRRLYDFCFEIVGRGSYEVEGITLKYITINN